MIVQALFTFIILVLLGILVVKLWHRWFGTPKPADPYGVESRAGNLDNLRSRKEDLTESLKMAEEMVVTKKVVNREEKKLKSLDEKI